MRIINKLNLSTAKVIVVRKSTKNIGDLTKYKNEAEKEGLKASDLLYVDLDAANVAELRIAYEELIQLCRAHEIYTILDDSVGKSGQQFIKGYLFKILFGKDVNLWSTRGVFYKDNIKFILGNRWKSISRECQSKELIDDEFEIKQWERIEVKTEKDFKLLVNELKKTKEVDIDIETDRFQFAHKEAKILCLQFGVEQHPNKAWVVWYDKSDIQNPFKDKVYKVMRWVLQNKTIVAQNGAAFDVPWLCTQFNINPMEVDQVDTMALCYIARNSTNREPMDLKTNAFPALGSYDDELDHFKKEYCKEHKLKLAKFSYDMIPHDILFRYSADDIIALKYIHKKFKEECINHKAGNLYERVWNRFYKNFVRLISTMEWRGIPFDLNRAKKELKELCVERTELENSIKIDPAVKKTEKLLSNIQLKKDVGIYNKKVEDRKAQGKEFKGKVPDSKEVEFNANSNNHIQKLLYEVIGMKVESLTASGAPSTDGETIKKFAKDFPEIEVLSKFDKVFKLTKEITSFYEPYIEQAQNSIDGRIRGFIKLNGTVSGRISQTDVNILQVPRESDFKKLLSFTEEEGKCIVGADFSNLEGNYATILTGDKGFLNQRKYAGNDGHSYNAIIVSPELQHLDSKNPEHIKFVKENHPKLRQKIKSFSFQTLYLASHYGIAYNLGIPLDEAETMWKKFWEDHKELNEWYEEGRKFMEEHEYIELTGGLILNTPGINSIDEKEARQAYRTASNARVQSGAYYTHDSMHRIMFRCKTENIEEVYPIIAIHDASYFECLSKDKEKVGKIIEEEMTREFMENQLFPLEAESEWGLSLKLEKGLIHGN